MSAAGYVDKAAELSPCGLYRYTLRRTWDRSVSAVVFVGLNPSTADAERDDPTLRRCVSFARAWGYGGVVMVNLFAFRATDPKDMKRARDPVGVFNDGYISEQAQAAGCVVAVWGAGGRHLNRDLAVMRLLRACGVKPLCLGTTNDGSPRHPLYLPK
ncbi:MAG: hypothetical protein A2213_00065, partial [Lysobacterales bacterium RIFOXYA1_FULL_68_6]